VTEDQSEGDGPGEDADVVGFCNRVHRVVHDLEQNVLHDLGQTLRCRHSFGGPGQLKRDREHEACHDGKQRRQERANDIQHHHRPHPGLTIHLVVGDGGADQDQHQNRRNGFQGADKEIAEQAHGHCGLGPDGGEDDPGDEAYDDLGYQLASEDEIQQEISARMLLRHPRLCIVL
jgi:hypothetical protein